MQFDRIKYIFKIWLNQSKKIIDFESIIDIWLGSKCEHNFTWFYLKKNKILRLHVKDKSCNSPEDLRLY